MGCKWNEITKKADEFSAKGLKSQLTATNNADLVYLSDGQLRYNTYANFRDSIKTNQIPDFSHAGYKGGGVPIPNAAVVKTISPIEGDNRQHIQAAIDEIAALPLGDNGLRGAILLKAGIYHVGDILYIRSSGIVLRGEGTGINQTVIVGINNQRTFDQDWTKGLIMIQPSSYTITVGGASKRLVGNFFPTGSRKIIVEAGHGLSAGDRIELIKTVNQSWIDSLKMAQYGWTTDNYQLKSFRKLTSVIGDTLELDMSLYDPIYNMFGGGRLGKVQFDGFISNSGVENIRMEAKFESNTSEKHDANAIVIEGAENCWVRNMAAKYFFRGGVLLLGNTHFVTVEDCGMVDHKSQITGGRRYSFDVEHGAFGNLFQRCYVQSGRHAFVSGSKVPGPNVFLDNTSVDALGGAGPHHRYATGQLYDNIWQNKSEIAASNNGSYGTGHGWTGAGILFWNSEGSFRVASPPYTMNWAIGNIGGKYENGVGGGGTSPGSAIWQYHDTHIQPRSLYLQQLKERLGRDAVFSTTTEDQRNGTLRQKLFLKTTAILQELPAGVVFTAQYSNLKASNN